MSVGKSVHVCVNEVGVLQDVPNVPFFGALARKGNGFLFLRKRTTRKLKIRGKLYAKKFPFVRR